tara:strand:+ start:2314 stop:3723 length:1410 start_codon:yes stop_codon:yes gene_type:complete
MSLILPSHYTGSAGPVVRNSLAFNKSDAGYLKFTPSGSPTSLRKGIVSFWMRGTGVFNGTTNDYRCFSIYQSSGNLQFSCGVSQGGAVDFYQYNGSGFTFRLTSTSTTLITDRGWHHFVFVWDTTQAVSTDRLSIYVDGSKITSFSTSNYPALNADMYPGSSREHFIGRFAASAATCEAVVAQLVYQDGQSFGDISDYYSDEGRPVDPSELLLGTDGDIWKFEGSTLAEIIAGQQGTHVMSSSNITSGDQRIDVPDGPAGDNQAGTFAIFDPSDADTVLVGQTGILATGNKLSDSIELSQPVTAGRWFAAIAPSTGANAVKFGIVNQTVSTPPGAFVDAAGGWGTYWNLGASSIYAENSNSVISSAWPVAMTSGDYMLVAFDADNGKLWLGLHDVSSGLNYWFDSSFTYRTSDEPGLGTNQTYTVTGTSWRFAVTIDNAATATLFTGAEQVLQNAPLPLGFKYLSSSNQ